MHGNVHPLRSDVATSLSLPQAAQYLGVHEKTIRRWIRAGRLPAIRVGGPKGRFRITVHDLDGMTEVAA